MRKVLILAYDFPPYVSVGGLRPYHWFKTFKTHALYPIVVTRQWDIKYNNKKDYVLESASKCTLIEETPEGLLIKAPYKSSFSNKLYLKYGENKYTFIRKIMSAYLVLMQYIIPVGTKRTLYKAAKKYLKENKVDYIIATGDPFVLFHYASKLSTSFNIPWIADYRDPWSQDSSISSSILKFIYAILEKKTLKNCSLATTVCTKFKNQLQKLVPSLPVEIIANGYDTNHAPNISISNTSKRLKIAHAGSILEYHPIDSFLSSIADFNAKHPHQLELHLYGLTNEEEIKEKISTTWNELKKRIFFYPKMSNASLKKELQQYDVVLLFNYYEIPGTKIYDYITLNKKILFCFTSCELSEKKYLTFYNQSALEVTDNEQEKILKDTNTGIFVDSPKNLHSKLNELVVELYKYNTIACEAKNVDNYSRTKQITKFASLIKSINKKTQ